MTAGWSVWKEICVNVYASNGTRNENIPAKWRPASLQVIAVIIICELSRECTKFGGKAAFCRWTAIWNFMTEKLTMIMEIGNESMNKVLLTASPSFRKARHCKEVRICMIVKQITQIVFTNWQWRQNSSSVSKQLKFNLNVSQPFLNALPQVGQTFF